MNEGKTSLYDMYEVVLLIFVVVVVVVVVVVLFGKGANGARALAFGVH